MGDWTVIVDAARLPEVATYLRDAPEARFNFCSDITATDWPPRAQRFDVIYSLYSVPLRHRVRLKLRTAESAGVPSVTGVWPAANWLEREVFDMFGIAFSGHPELRRLIMPEDWEGHPLRKDYPVQVKLPVRTYEPLQLTEEEFAENLQADRELRPRR